MHLTLGSCGCLIALFLMIIVTCTQPGYLRASFILVTALALMCTAIFFRIGYVGPISALAVKAVALGLLAFMFLVTACREFRSTYIRRSKLTAYEVWAKTKSEQLNHFQPVH